MSKLALISLLLLTSCNVEIRSGLAIAGGKITGKFIRAQIEPDGWHSKEAMHFFLTVVDSGNVGEVEVTQEAWNQATTDMKWPFEIK